MRMWEVAQRRSLLLLRGSGWPDLVLAFVVGVVQVAGSRLAANGQPEREPLDALAIVLLVAGPLLLIGRRRFPVAVLWPVTGLSLAFMLLGYPYGPVMLSVIVAAYTAVTEGHRAAAWLAVAALYGAHFTLPALFGWEMPSWIQAIAVAAWLFVVLISLEVVRAHRERRREAERTAQEEARRRASEERLHIARELHDVLAHHISLINVQAGVALHLSEKKPEQTRIALTAIEHASREAMGELRSVLSILGQPGEQAPRAPVPSLARVDALVSQALAAGLKLHTEVEGTPRPLPAPVEAAAFRIIQEALTNIVRHARAVHATIHISYGAHDLTIQVDDDGDGTAPRAAVGGGNGIPGMQERVRSLGGEFTAGRLPDRGFRVRARLPEAGAS